MATPDSLKDRLAGSLSEGFRCKIRYIRSPARPCDPLFAPLPGDEPEKTRLSSHFLAVSIEAESQTQEIASPDVLVLGIETLVYSTKHLTTIFVSKADSTGYLPQQRLSPAKAILTTFLWWLAERERAKHWNRKVVISLFARSQSQYLFPGSAENSQKHVLDDRQLIKWWARVLDPIFPETHDAENGPTCDGYITVPGYEGGELRQFMPPMSLQSAKKRWTAGNPLVELARTRQLPPNAPARSLLPRFPDDPKARFMQDLDGEVGIADDTTTSPSKRKGGKWNSIRDLDRFWEAMEFRQECSSGRLVGFLWLVMQPKGSGIDQASQEASQESVESSTNGPSVQADNETSLSKITSKRRLKPLSGPIVPRQPRLKGGSSSLTATSDLAGMVNSDTVDGAVLSKEGYDKAMQTLLHLDFATLDSAAESTKKWESEIAGIGGFQADWSIHVSGTVKSQASLPASNGSNDSADVNDLGGMVRKKRKNDSQSDVQHPVATPEAAAVNVLTSSMVRKKPKFN